MFYMICIFSCAFDKDSHQNVQLRTAEPSLRS